MNIDNPFVDPKIVDIYQAYTSGYHHHHEALEALVKFLPRKAKILEVGVGTGSFTELLISAGYDVCGIDASGLMLSKATKSVKAISGECELLDYVHTRQFGAVLSHSGGFTFNDGMFETYYQNQDFLGLAFQKIHSLLVSGGQFLINRGNHERRIELGSEASLTIDRDNHDGWREYKYTFQQGEVMVSRNQRRVALLPADLQVLSAPYFQWNLDDTHWISGVRQ